MLRLDASGDCLFDEYLPEVLKVLPGELARADEIFSDPALLAPFRTRWQAMAEELHSPMLSLGRPSLPMATYLRLMWLKQKTGWGYERLMGEVSDSFALRRFCRIPVVEDVPDESTVRKLTRRLGPDVVDELTRGVLGKAVHERGFRPRALRVDSTVAEADIAYPTDVGLAADAVRVLAKAARRVAAAVPTTTRHVADRSRAVGKRVRAIGRSLRRRSGEAKEAVQTLTEEAAARVAMSVRESKKLLAEAKRSRSRAKGISKKARARAIARLEHLIGLSERVVDQVRARFAGERIPDRLVSLFDPDARPVRRGKLSRPNEFGYVVQLAEVTANTRKGARGLLLPPKLQAGSTHENTLLAGTAVELERLGVKLKEASFDAGFGRVATTKALPGLERIFISGSATNTGSARTRRRLARFRVGCEGRISHVKREYHAGRSRLRGDQGARIWESWTVLAYDVDTVARM